MKAGQRGQPSAEILREQRDGLARLRERLFGVIRRLQEENDSLRKELERYRGFPSIEQQERELAEAKRLERDPGIPFQRMPEDVYPGKPYVTQLELIRRGITRYSRQNISRLTREERSVPALTVADRVLLPPEGVKALLRREALAIADVSPRRRPGTKRTSR